MIRHPLAAAKELRQLRESYGLRVADVLPFMRCSCTTWYGYERHLPHHKQNACRAAVMAAVRRRAKSA